MTRLTIGGLRRVIDGQDDDTPIVVAVGVSVSDAAEALAVSAWMQASDAVPTDLGGTDPATEATRGVLFVQTWADDGPRTVCRQCGLGIEQDGERWQHSNGHSYRHNAEPEPFKLAPWVQIDTLTADSDEGSRMVAWLRRRFRRTA